MHTELVAHPVQICLSGCPARDAAPQTAEERAAHHVVRHVVLQRCNMSRDRGCNVEVKESEALEQSPPPALNARLFHGVCVTRGVHVEVT